MSTSNKYFFEIRSLHVHSYNLFITCISYKRFESIWQCKPLYMQERPNFKLLFALYVFPFISSFAKTVNTRRYTLSFAVWHISWNLYAVNQLLFLTTLFPDYLVCTRWEILATTRLLQPKRRFLERENSFQHMFACYCI